MRRPQYLKLIAILAAFAVGQSLPVASAIAAGSSSTLSPAEQAEINKKAQEYIAKSKAEKSTGEAAPSANSAEATESPSEGLSKLTQVEEKTTTSTASATTSAATSAEEGTSPSILLLVGGAAVVILAAIIIVIRRDARRSAPVSSSTSSAGASRDAAAQLRKRRAKAKAARRQRRRTR
jgi:cobalamin biosynthesis Mg chelatase CobN